LGGLFANETDRPRFGPGFEEIIYWLEWDVQIIFIKLTSEGGGLMGSSLTLAARFTSI
jgi:hypothetical protein